MNKFMNRVNIINRLQTIADSFNALAEELKAAGAYEEHGIKVKEVPITKDAVRERLYTLSQAGKSSEVKSLLNKFGAKKLTEVAAEHYEELLKGAELLN
jgi:uncharacterized protein YkuJ